jgi:NAD(P)-dependent dehydrogenase (short-subunit alcohol dehydrogenase family)
MGKMDGRIAVVTGGAQGIGFAIAKKLANEGATVVIGDLDEAKASKAAATIGGSTTSHLLDVGDEESVANFYEKLMGAHGRIDALVNNAAIVPFTNWDDVDFKEWRRIMRVDLDGTFLMCRAAQTHMRTAGYGRIVNIASNAFLAGTPNMAAYLAAKGGVVGLTRALATELGTYSITANAVAPGLTASDGVLASPHKDAFGFVEMLQALKRPGTPDDIAPVVAFLASEESGWITGQLYVADGGHIRY